VGVGISFLVFRIKLCLIVVLVGLSCKVQQTPISWTFLADSVKMLSSITHKYTENRFPVLAVKQQPAAYRNPSGDSCCAILVESRILSEHVFIRRVYRQYHRETPVGVTK
jgi:hypothetical protein